MNNTLENGFKILEYLAMSGAECSVKELACHFSLPNSHVCRLLKTLLETGYIQQTQGSRKYRISLKILNLSHTALGRISMRNAARNDMRKLAEEVKCPVFLSSYYAGQSLVVATEYPELFSGDAGLNVGQIHPVNLSACGKICAAYAPEDIQTRLIELCDWTPYTCHSICSEKDFLNELIKVKSQGYSIVKSELQLGIGGVGAPIFGVDGVIVGALGVMLPIGEARWEKSIWNSIIKSTKQCAVDISKNIGAGI